MNTIKPLVTFVLFAYKQENYVREAVDAALAQTYSPLEIIISDDCSPDQTFQIIQKIVANYDGPHKIILNRNNKNIGLAGHLRKCLEMASSDWVVIAAGDDISLPERTSVLMEFAESRSNIGGIWSNYEIINDQGSTIAKKGLPPTELLIGSTNLNSYLFGSPKKLPLHASGCATAWHRSVFSINSVIPENCWCEDLFFSIRCLALGRDILRISPALVKYRNHENNISGFLRKHTTESNLKIASLLKKSAQTCLMISDDIKLIMECELSTLDKESLINLNSTAKMISQRWDLDSKTFGNETISPREIWRLRNYYTKLHLMSLIKTSLTVSMRG